MEWDKFLKRYVWDDDTTPYLVPAAKLTRRQARSELKAYAIFVGCLFAVVALVTLSSRLPGGRAPGMSLYAFTMVCAAVLLVTMRHPFTAIYSATGPIASLIFFYHTAGESRLGAIDYIVIIAFAALWLRYCLRVYRITIHYEQMEEGEDAPGVRRHWGRKR